MHPHGRVVAVRSPIKGGLRDNRIHSRKLTGVDDWITYPAIMPNSDLVTHHPFDAEIDHFIDCIVNDVESHGNVRDGVNTHEAISAIDRFSHLGGERIAIGS
jgi:predicted dehydrogenase